MAGRRIDFDVQPADNRRLRVLCRQVNPSQEQPLFYDIMEVMKSQTTLHLKNCPSRALYVRIVNSSVFDQIDWTSYQYHRMIFGYIAVAVLKGPDFEYKQFAVAEAAFDDQRRQWKSLHSVCIVAGLKRVPIELFRKDIVFLTADSSDASEFRSQIGNLLSTFYLNLFWILESKWKTKFDQKPNLMETPFAPTEQLPSNNDEGQMYLKRLTVGRNKKQLADLSLLSGRTQEAQSQYLLAIKRLRSAGDNIWLAGALEGYCLASYMLDPSLQGGAILEDSATPIILNNDSMSDLIPSPDYSSDQSKISVRHTVSIQELVNKFCEALNLYHDNEANFPLCFEGFLKFIRILTANKRKMDLCETLDFAISKFYLTSLLSEQKTMFSLLVAGFYGDVGMRRKEAFYLRESGLAFFNPAWKHESNLSLDQACQCLVKASSLLIPSDQNRSSGKGWRVIQKLLLVEVCMAHHLRKAPMDAMRYVLFTLELYRDILTEKEETTLHELIRENQTVTASLQNSPVSLLRPLPYFRSLEVRPLSKCPVVRLADKAHSGPFIFSSFRNQPKKEPDIFWTCGESCTVALELENPLLVSMNLEQLCLTTAGVSATVEALVTELLPLSRAKVVIQVIPESEGQLIIKGYSLKVFSFSVVWTLATPAIVQVAPPLPTMSASFDIPAPGGLVCMDDGIYSVRMYSDTRTTGILRLENQTPVEITSFTIKKVSLQDHNFLRIDTDAVGYMPLVSGTPQTFEIELNTTDVPTDLAGTELECQLLIEYSSVSGGVVPATYGRQCSVTLRCKVQCCLEILDAHLMVIPRHPCCCQLYFTARNLLDQQITVELVVDRTYLHRGCPSFQLEDVKSLAALSDALLSVVCPTMSIWEDQFMQNQISLQDALWKYFSKCCRLSWRTMMDAVEVSGNSRLPTTMIPSLIEHLHGPPYLLLGISHESTELLHGCQVDVELHQPFFLSITVTSLLGFSLSDVVLTIFGGDDFYGDQPKITWTGSLYRYFPKVPPGFVAEQIVGLVFLQEGRYELDVVLQLTSLDAWRQASPSAVAFGSVAPPHGDKHGVFGGQHTACLALTTLKFSVSQ